MLLKWSQQAIYKNITLYWISTIIPNISWFENSWWILLFSINDMLKPSIKVFILEKKPYRVFKMGLYLHVPMFWLKYYFLLKLLVYFQFIMTDNIHLKAWFLAGRSLKESFLLLFDTLFINIDELRVNYRDRNNICFCFSVICM